MLDSVDPLLARLQDLRQEVLRARDEGQLDAATRERLLAGLEEVEAETRRRLAALEGPGTGAH